MAVLSANEVAWLVTNYFPLGKTFKVKGEDHIITEQDQLDLICISYGESGWDTLSIGYSPEKRADGTANPNWGQADLGLWQISTYWHYDKFKISNDWRNPFVNTDLAVQAFREGGLKQWHALGGREFLKAVPMARMALPRPVKPCIIGPWTS